MGKEQVNPKKLMRENLSLAHEAERLAGQAQDQHGKMERFQDALEFYNEARKYANQAQDSRIDNKVLIYRSMQKIYLNTQQYEHIIYTHNKINNLIENEPSTTYQSSLLASMFMAASAYIKIQKWPEALECFNIISDKGFAKIEESLAENQIYNQKELGNISMLAMAYVSANKFKNTQNIAYQNEIEQFSNKIKAIYDHSQSDNPDMVKLNQDLQQFWLELKPAIANYQTQETTSSSGRKAKVKLEEETVMPEAKRKTLEEHVKKNSSESKDSSPGI